MSELLTRAAPITGSASEADRTVEVCFASEQPVRRYSWEHGEYLEILTISDKAIQTERFDTGMSVLDSHRAQSMDARIGSVVPKSLRIEGKRAFVTLKFSRKAKAEEVFRDILDGHTTPISVGYRVDEYLKTEGGAGSLPTMRAVAWAPMEISTVPVPADFNAHTRNEENMPRRNYLDDPAADDEVLTRTVESQDANRKLRKAERVDFIRSLLAIGKRAGDTGVDDEELEELVSDTRNMSQEQIRAAFFEMKVRQDERAPTFPHSETFKARGDGSQFQHRADALYARLTGTAPTAEARQFMGDRLEDHARGLLEAEGVNTRSMSREELFGISRRNLGGMHTTSDFPMLLQGAGRRVLAGAYEAAGSPLKSVLARQATLSDFRASSRLKLSDGGRMERVNEHGEVKSITRGEVAESYRLDTYASIFSLTRQALINDDLGAFGDFTRTAGQMAAETENELLFELLTEASGAGPIMGEDSVRLFHASHGNLASTGTALSVDSLSAARKALRQQHGIGGKTRINVVPRYLLVGPELETEGEKVLAQIAATKVADSNPFAGKLELLVDPRITDFSWYVFADPANVPILEYAHLSSAPGPQLATREGFTVMGTEFRVSLDFGAGAIDFRGAYRNPGQQPGE